MNTEDKENQRFELEDQFILRLPLPQAKKVRKVLNTKPKKIKKILSINLNDNMRQGTVCVKKHLLKAKVVDFPTIIESYKTNDQVNLYKTADISQMMICTHLNDDDSSNNDDDSVIENAEDVKLGAIPKVKKKFKHPHGLTNPLRNVKKRRFRKVTANKNIICNEPEVEKELLYLLRADFEAISTRYEIIYEDIKTEDNTKLKELDIFGEISETDSEYTDVSGSQKTSTSNLLNDLVVYNN